MKGFAPPGPLTQPQAGDAPEAYPLDIDLIDIRETSGWPYKIARFLALPIECLLRTRMGWQYPGAVCWIQMGMAALALSGAALSTPAFVFLSAFFFRAAGLQIQALKRARWGADHDVAGYSGGESIFTRRRCGVPAGLKERTCRERQVRMFFEPLLCLAAALFLWPDGVGVYLGVAAPALLFKQLREFHYLRRKQQSMHTRQEKVEWWQGLIHAKHRGAQVTGQASASAGPAVPTGDWDVQAMKARMPPDLQRFMGGDKPQG